MSVIHWFSALAQVWTSLPPLPSGVTNNAVATWSDRGTAAVYSFLGLDSTKQWSGVSNRTFRWTLGAATWDEIAPVPGPGRLAGTAQMVGDRVVVFGGYTVAPDGSEHSLPNVDIYHPASASWSGGSPMPVPVDDAVSGVWRDSLIYLISGWHDRDNVSNVQIYDAANDSWLQATPIPGTPVFGHAGGIAGNTIVYIDGVRRNAGRPGYEMEPASWRGDIDPRNPTAITWIRLDDHPGAPLYRTASAAIGDLVLFAGGTDNPYNYSGIGYNGVPATPSRRVFAFDVVTGRWRDLPRLNVASMDHRGIVFAGDMLLIVGGMLAGQRVTSRVAAATIANVIGER